MAVFDLFCKRFQPGQNKNGVSNIAFNSVYVDDQCVGDQHCVKEVPTTPLKRTWIFCELFANFL